MLCRLCQHDRKLVDAHIIPKPFFTAYLDGNKGKLLSNSLGMRPKRSRTGVYDSGILCGTCDKVIGVWDEYGVRVLLQELRALSADSPTGVQTAFQRPNYDYNRLKLFILSVLWRASESSRDFSKKVKLGPCQERLFRMLRAEDPGAPEDFPIFLSAFTVNGRIPASGIPILDPYREKWDGVDAYRLYLGVIAAYVKMDHRPFSYPFAELMLRPERPLMILDRDYDRSQEKQVVLSILSSKQNQCAFGPRL